MVVYLHWGIEYQTCPSALTRPRWPPRSPPPAPAAVIGTHAHVLQGAGWLQQRQLRRLRAGQLPVVASFGNIQDDNGVLTLTSTGRASSRAHFAPSHLDARGVPVPATGAERRRIPAECAGDRAAPTCPRAPPR